MAHPRTPLALLALGLFLSGCQLGALMAGEDFNTSNIPATSSGGSGTAYTGGSGTGGSGATGGGPVASTPTEFSCASKRPGTGVITDQLTGTSPTNLTPTTALQVAPVYVNGSSVKVGLDGVRGVVASVMAFDAPVSTGLLMDWVGGTLAYATQATRPESEPEHRQNWAGHRVRQLAAASELAPMPTRQVQAATTYTVGAQTTFQFLDILNGERTPVTVEAMYVTPQAGHGGFIVWVDVTDRAIFTGTASKLDAIVAEVRDRIYPIDTCTFGVDPTAAEAAAMPIDRRPLVRDDYLHLIFSHRVDEGTARQGILGYFSLSDLEPVSNSNQAKILYLAASSTSRSLADLFAVMAHEFQHLLFSCHRIQTIGMSNHHKEFGSDGTAWLNEGLSMLAMQLCGYGPEGSRPSVAILQQMAQYLSQTSNYSMTSFFQSSGNPFDAYGMVALFLQYLDDRLGDEAMRDFHTMNNTSSMLLGSGDVSSTDLADQVLKARGTSLPQMFSDFAATLVVDGQATGSLTTEQLARFQLSSVNLRKTYQLDGKTIPLNGPSRLSAYATIKLRPYTAAFVTRSVAPGTHLDLNLNGGQGYQAKLILTR